MVVPDTLVTLRHLAEALSLSSVPQDAAAIEVEWLTPDGAAFELRPSTRGIAPFRSQASSTLRNFRRLF